MASVPARPPKTLVPKTMIRKDRMTTSKRLFQRKAVLQFAALALCGSLWLTGCSEDELVSQPAGGTGDGSLVFTVSPQSGWNEAASTRSAASAQTAKPIAVTGGEQPLYLHVSTENYIAGAKSAVPAGVATRGAMYEEENFWKRFSLFGYTHAAGTAFGDDCTPDFCYNLEVEKQGAESSTTYRPKEGTYFLPGKGTDVTFFAMAPYPADLLGKQDAFNNQTNSIPAADEKGVPEFEYFVPWYACNQQDLCFIKGTEVKGGDPGNVELKFYHVLTAIRVVADASVPKATVKQVRITNAHNRGIYTPNMTSDGTPGSWQLTTDMESANGHNHTGGGGNNSPEPLDVQIGGVETVICGDESGVTWSNENRPNTYFMLPQTLGADNRLEIDYILEGETNKKTLKASLDGQTWEMGTTVTYRLSKQSANIDFDVTTNDPTTIAYSGGQLDFNVTAKKEEEALPYVIEYSDGQNGTWTQVWTSEKPDQLTNGEIVEQVERESTGTGTYDQKLYITGAPMTQTYIEGGANYKPYTAITSGPGSSATNRYDLSFDNGNDTSSGRTTSNCYIVPKAGFYKFPAVCGAMIKNGQHENSVNGKGFMNGAGTVFNTGDKSTYCLKNGKVEILWQDSPGLISNVYTQANSQSTSFVDICFEVSKSTIVTGNAVIGFFNTSGKLIWSWHIWVSNTAESETVNIASYSDNSSRIFLQQPIGWVPEGHYKRDWKARSGQLRFRLKDESLGVEPISFTISQATYSEEIQTNGRYLMFQWGRKDPVAPIKVDRANGYVPVVNDEVYGPNDTYYPKKGYGSLNQAAMHNQPHRLTTDNSYIKKEAWNVTTGNYNQGTQKSPYDPSPRNWKVPPKVAFEGLFKTSTLCWQYNGYSTSLRGDTDITLGSGYQNTGWISKRHNNWYIPLMGVFVRSTNFELYATTIIAAWESGLQNTGQNRDKAHCMGINFLLNNPNTSHIDVYGEGGDTGSGFSTGISNPLNAQGVFCVQD